MQPHQTKMTRREMFVKNSFDQDSQRICVADKGLHFLARLTQIYHGNDFFEKAEQSFAREDFTFLPVSRLDHPSFEIQKVTIHFL